MHNSNKRNKSMMIINKKTIHSNWFEKMLAHNNRVKYVRQYFIY